MAEVDPDTGAAPDRSAEVSDPAAARAAFLASAPEIIAQPDATVEVDEDAVIDELTRPPAATDPPATPAPEVDPFAAYGGKEVVENALQVRQALQSELGIRTLVAQGLNTLGYTPEQIAAALGKQAAPGAPAEPEGPSDPLAGFDDDDLVTAADMRRILAEQSGQATQAREAAVAAARAELDPVKAALDAQRNQEIAQRNDQTLAELLGPVPIEADKLGQYQTMANATIQAAGRYVEPNNFDPVHIRSAIVRGHADVVAAEEARYQAYLATKREARRAAPANIGGQSAGETPEAEPKNLKEASAQARAAGLFQD